MATIKARRQANGAIHYTAIVLCLECPWDGSLRTGCRSTGGPPARQRAELASINLPRLSICSDPAPFTAAQEDLEGRG
jgi:hypothetical protein